MISPQFLKKIFPVKAGKGDSLKLPSRHHAQYEDTNIDKVVVTMTPSEFKQKFSDDLQRSSFDGLQDSGDYGYIDDRKRLDTRNRRVSVKIEKNHDIIDNVETSMTLPNPAESNERNGFRYNNQSSNGEFESREIYNKLARDEGGMNAQSKQRESSRNYHEGNNTSLRRRKRSVFEGPNIESNVETGPENDFGNTGSSRGKENWKRIVGKVTESNQDNSNSSMSRGTSRGKENWKRIVRKLKESNNIGIDLNSNNIGDRMNEMSVTKIPSTFKKIEAGTSNVTACIGTSHNDTTANRSSGDDKSGRKVSFSLSGDHGSNGHFETSNLRSVEVPNTNNEDHGTTSNGKSSKHRPSTSLTMVRKYSGTNQNITVESDEGSISTNENDEVESNWFYGRPGAGSSHSNEMTKELSNQDNGSYYDNKMHNGESNWSNITYNKIDSAGHDYVTDRQFISSAKSDNFSGKSNSRKTSEVVLESPIHPVKEVKSGAENWAFVFERLKALNMMEKVKNAKPNILDRQDPDDVGSNKNETSEQGYNEQDKFENDDVATSEPSETYESSLPDYDYDHYDYGGEKKKISLWAKVKHAFRRQER